MKSLKNNLPFVSVIIPCKNEEEFINRCLDSLIKNDYPKDSLEILVYDGQSIDKTKDIIKEHEGKYSFIKLRDNRGQLPCFALNLGIKESMGRIIIRCDAHVEYSRNYIEKLVYWISKDKSIGNVGGICINRHSNNGFKAKSIAYTLGHNFCVGPNKFRTGVKKPQEVDTVPFGAWRREIFNSIGLFNEKFLKAEDLELNMRIKKAGYKILLDPEIKAYYYPRDSFKKLFSMMFQYGYWRNFVNRELKILSSFRQVVPPLFIIYLISLIFLSFLSLLFILPLLIYLFLLLFFSLLISIQKKDIKVFPFCALAFVTTHIGYGLGYIKGFWDTWVLRKKDSAGKQAETTR